MYFVHSVPGAWIFQDTLLGRISLTDIYTSARNHNLWFAKEIGARLILETTEIHIV